MVRFKLWIMAFSLMSVLAKSEEGNVNESVLRIKNQIPYLNEETAPFEENLDSNLVNWYLNEEVLMLSPQRADSIDVPKASDSVLVERLMALSEQSEIEFPFNDKVKSFISLYTNRRRNLTETVLGLSSYYFPIFEAELDRQNMPMELKYLPVIESALNPRAFSRAGASGLWQFVYGTGRFYKLEISTYIDERKDPIASTEKAVKYLKDLYKIYNDWFLVIAAYNCGPGNVNKAIRRSGGAKDYWKIYYRLPRETRGYVPAFIAATYAITYHEEHKLYAKPSTLPRMTDTISVSQPLHLKQVSEVLHIPYELLRDLNPQYRRDYIPGGSKTYALVLPAEKTFSFIDKAKEVYAYKKDELVAQKRAHVSVGNSSFTPTAPSGRTKLIYKVKSGDNLGYIAEWYHVRLSDLRYWNNIYRNTIRVGQKLVVYVPKNKSEHYKNVNNMSFAAKQASVGKKVLINKTTSASTPQPRDGNYAYYTVRRGDNLYSIAKRYPGVSAQNIMDINGMKTASISPGMTLKIPSDG